MAKDERRIHPGRQVIMRLPGTDPNRDPWTGAAVETGRNLPDDAPIDENVHLMPPLGKTSAEVGAALADPIKPEELLDANSEDASPREALQFSLRDAVVLMASVSVCLGFASWLSPGVLAAVLGALTLLFLWAAHECQLTIRWTRTVGISLVAAYATAAMTAMLGAWWR